VTATLGTVRGPALRTAEQSWWGARSTAWLGTSRGALPSRSCARLHGRPGRVPPHPLASAAGATAISNASAARRARCARRAIATALRIPHTIAATIPAGSGPERWQPGPILRWQVAHGGYPWRKVLGGSDSDPREGKDRDGAQRRRAGVPVGKARARGIRGHDDPHGQDHLVCAQASVSVRRRVRLPVPVRAAARVVPAARLHGRDQLRRPRPAGRRLPDAVRRARPPRRVLRPSPRSAKSDP